MRNASAVRCAVVALLSLTSGCAALDGYLPQVRFQELAVNELDFTRADVDFVFAVDNPNPVEIELSQFSYALGLEGIQLIAGDDADGMGLEAIGSSELALPVELIWEDAWNVVQATQGLDYVGFQLDGDFGFETPIGEALIPYDEDGDFPAVRTPQFTLQSARVASFDPTNLTSTLEIGLGVTNEHASSLFFERFAYELKMQGSPVADGEISVLGEVFGAAATGSTEGTLTLPVVIDLANVSVGVYNAIVNKEEIVFGLGAEMDVDTPFGLMPLSIDENGNLEIR
jgi:LEA14-like dessication related protein